LPNQPYNMKVSIKELSFKAIIGILPIERKETQRVIIDINFEYVFHKTNDEFIDYSCIAKTAKKIMKKKQFKLIEDAIIFLEKKLYKKYNIYINPYGINFMSSAVILRHQTQGVNSL